MLIVYTKNVILG